MPAYITLYKWTKQGLDNVTKNTPDDLKRGRAQIEQAGGRVIGVWVTLGEYDLVMVSEAPDDATAASWALMVGKDGNLTSQTLKAFSEEEFAQIVAKLP